MFEIEENKNKKSNQTIKRKNKRRIDINTKRTLIISGTLFLIVFLIIYFYQKKQENNYSKIKLEKNNYLVYTKYQKKNSNYKIFVPFINLKGDVIEKVNEDIDLFTNEFIADKRCTVLYEYDISGIILSVIVKAIDYNTEYAPETYFRSYNINLNTLEVISNESLLDFFDTNLSTVEELIDNQFKMYYQDIVSDGYFHQNECNYNCFLSYRGIDDYLKNVVYYVKEGNLVAYEPFITYSIYGEEDYFEDEDFEILIVETEKN